MITELKVVKNADGISHVEPVLGELGPKRREIPNEVAVALTRQFSLPAFDRFARVDDDSLRPATLVIDGHRIAYNWPSGSRTVDWCLLTGEVNLPGYILAYYDGGRLRHMPVSNLSMPIRFDARVMAWASRDEAEADLRSAIEQAGRDQVEWHGEMVRALKIVEIPMAQDEIDVRSLDVRRVRERLDLKTLTPLK